MSGQVAIVTGASRGIGRGVATGLGEAGWTVYVTARTFRDGESDRPGSVTKTAEQITRAGGHGIPVVCDHSVDSETEAVFRRVEDEQGGLDLLVNNATSYSTDLGPREDAMFWNLPVEEWDQMHAVGLRSYYTASACAARMMVRRGSGLIVNISSIGAIKYTGNVSYNVVKAAVDMLTLSTAQELRPHNVAVVSFWPRLTRTEALIPTLRISRTRGKHGRPSSTGDAWLHWRAIRGSWRSQARLWTWRKWLSRMDWRTPTAESPRYARDPDPFGTPTARAVTIRRPKEGSCEKSTATI